MAKVITFSRQFPKYHQQAGQPTYFVEKFIEWFWDNEVHNYHNVEDYLTLNNIKLDGSKDATLISELFDSLLGCIDSWKSHTVRAGKRFKVGEYFSPRIWSGKPYNSKQIIIGPDIQIKKIWDFEITKEGIVIVNNVEVMALKVRQIAYNDGLSYVEFLQWFKYPSEFKGQIICWNKSIKY